MGGKCARTIKFGRIRNHLKFCLALVTCLAIVGSSCSTVESIKAKVTQMSDGPRQHLTQAQEFLARDDYGKAIQENQAALVAAGNREPADEALFNLGVLYTLPAIEKENPRKAFQYFQRLTKDFPQSPWVGQARILMNVMKNIEGRRQIFEETRQEAARLKRIFGEMSQENEKLKRASAEVSAENQKLKRIIEQSRIVDIEIDEKKRSQAK